ncbi:MAG: M23 family metallopeptidase [Deltaproteobacteria bacterium]|nr:M23 family metallopeptidase [Nannocystaceae bacterium]
MRTRDRFVTSCGLGLVLALAGCSSGSAGGESGASTGQGETTSGDEETGAELGATSPNDESTDDGSVPATTDDGGNTSTSTGGEPPAQPGWCVYEVVANAEQTPLDVYASADPTSAVLYTLDPGETVWGASTVVAGYRDLDRSLAASQWAQSSRLSNTGECQDEPPLQEVRLPQGFQLPFVCGDAWRLDSWGHAPAIDMVHEPDQHGTEGAPLVAPAAGTVNQSYYHDNAGNMVQIDHGGGYFTTYLHMESRAVEVGAVLVPGDVIGAVGRTGPTSNDHPHLHFELGMDADGDGEASWGFSGAERVNPWFDNVEYGQSNSLTWRDVVSANCP